MSTMYAPTMDEAREIVAGESPSVIALQLALRTTGPEFGFAREQFWSALRTITRGEACELEIVCCDASHPITVTAYYDSECQHCNSVFRINLGMVYGEGINAP